MSQPTPGKGSDDSGEIADVAGLFRDEANEARGPAPASPPSKPDAGSYSLQGDDDVDFDADEGDLAMVPPVPLERPKRRRYRDEDEEEERPKVSLLDEEPVELDRVWTRWGEWWPTLLVLLVGTAVLIWIVQATFSLDDLGRPLFLLVLGGAGLIVLSYPILITLERPVRITPEQALADYFGALSHWFPHHRRMWLLLAMPSTEEPPLHSFGQFKAYWSNRLARLKATHNAGPTPLVFTIGNYKSEKSGGKTTLDAKYTIEVRRGSPQGEVLAAYRDSQRLVRGPDRMWYLTKGRMPESEMPAK